MVMVVPCFDDNMKRSGLEFLLKKSMLEEHEYGYLGTIDITVFAHADHTVTVHGLSGEELQFLEAAQQFLHVFVDVILEDWNLFGIVGFQIGDDPVEWKIQMS